MEHVKFPKDIEDAKQLGLVLSRYKNRYYAQVRVVLKFRPTIHIDVHDQRSILVLKIKDPYYDIGASDQET